MQLFNASEIDFEAVRNQAGAFANDANQWLASLDVDQFEAACVQGQAALVFEDGFQASEAAQRVMRSSVVKYMLGPTPSHTFDFGSLGSIWFDVELNDPDNDSARLVRVALAPPGTRPRSWACKDAQYVFVVHCLTSMYS